MKKLIALIAIVALTTPAVFAQSAAFTGDTTGGSTFNRPVSPTALSSVGTAVPYRTTAFTVNTTGNYNLTLFQTADTLYDTFLALYQNTFTPSASLTSLIAVDDDPGPANGSSLASVLLSANTPYIFVATGFNNTDFGQYGATISDVTRPTGSLVTLGGGTVVPEAGTALFALTTLPIIGMVLRRHFSK